MMILLPLFGVLTLARSALLVWHARRHRRHHHERPIDTSFTPSVSIVVPAYNEAVGIAAAVTSLATSHYPNVEVIVVDDGSTDRTLERVQSLVALGSANVRVVHQPNPGKADALNRGIDHRRGDLVVTVDGDSTFAPDTLALLVQPFRDSGVGAVSGNTKVANRHGVIGRWQHVEYVMSFNLDRRMYDRLACMPTVPGAIGAFRAVRARRRRRVPQRHPRRGHRCHDGRRYAPGGTSSTSNEPRPACAIASGRNGISRMTPTTRLRGIPRGSRTSRRERWCAGYRCLPDGSACPPCTVLRHAIPGRRQRTGLSEVQVGGFSPGCGGSAASTATPSRRAP